MSARILKAKDKILVVGPIYNLIDKVTKVQSIINEYEYIIFNGNLLYPEDDLENRIRLMNKLLESGKVIYNVGDYDLKHLKDYKTDYWINGFPNVIFVNYPSQTSFIITCGGVTSIMNREVLMNNLETSFVSNVNGRSWHLDYGGGYGYIISNNPLTDTDPNFYNFSAQIGNRYCGEKTNVYAQEIDQYGLKKTILL